MIFNSCCSHFETTPQASPPRFQHSKPNLNLAKPQDREDSGSTKVNHPGFISSGFFFFSEKAITYLPSARLMERNKGYSSGVGLPCWSSYRKTGARPTSTPSCWRPCLLYIDRRKDWSLALGLIVNRMEKSSGKTPPESDKRKRNGD